MKHWFIVDMNILLSNAKFSSYIDPKNESLKIATQKIIDKISDQKNTNCSLLS